MTDRIYDFRYEDEPDIKRDVERFEDRIFTGCLKYFGIGLLSLIVVGSCTYNSCRQNPSELNQPAQNNSENYDNIKK